MGNNCICLRNNNSSSTEIYTQGKIETHNVPTQDWYKSSEVNQEYDRNKIISRKDSAAEAEETLVKVEKKEQIISKAKAAAAPEIKESSVNNKSDELNKSFDRAMTKDTKAYYEEPPQLVQFPSKEDYFYYAMDLFNEVNKYRAEPQLFVDLVRKYPNVTVNKEYAKKAGFDIGWNQNLYDLLNEFLIENNDGILSLEFKNRIHESLHSNFLYHFELNTKELSIDKNICEIISRYYSKHKDIFQTDYSIGAVGIVKNKDLFRIVLLFA